MTDNSSLNKDTESLIQAAPDSSTTKANIKPKKENMLVNLVMNIIIPTLILTKLSGEDRLGPTWGLIIALSFPIVYGIKDFFRAHKFNVFSALGVVSVLLTGGISLMHLDTKYYAIKEAAIPGLIGLLVIISTKTRYPLVKTFLYNDTILKVEKIAAVLTERNNTQLFEKRLMSGSYFIACSFFLSAVLNYVLAKIIVVSPTGTPEFNSEIGKMHLIGFPVIAVPSLIIMVLTLMYIFKSIRELTDLSMDDVMQDDNQ